MIDPRLAHRAACIAALRAVPGARPDLLTRFITEASVLGWGDYRNAAHAVDDFKTYCAMLAPLDPFLLAVGFSPALGGGRIARIVIAARQVASGRLLGTGRSNHAN